MTTGDSESPSPHSQGEESSDSDVPSSSKSTAASKSNGVKETTPKNTSKKTENTRIIQVANIAPQATREQMLTLFGYMGKIDDLRLYPTMELGMYIPSKMCFVKFYESSCVGLAQHLTNTVFIDRALIVVPYVDGEIPDEQKALDLLGSGTLLPGIADPKLPQHVTSQIEGTPPNQVVMTFDPKLIEQQLPSYPPLPPTYDTRKIEEMRRTIIVANVDNELESQDVVQYFGQAGEVKYFRFCTRNNDPLHYALIEFSDQPSILDALHLNGTQLGRKVIKVYHATQAINKPQAKTNEAAQKEIEEAMSRQAQNLISQGIDGTGKNLRGRSRSRSRSRRRSISRGRIRRSRSKSRRRSTSRTGHGRVRSRSRHRDRDRDHRSKTKKSPSPVKARKRSRTPKRSKSRDRSRRSRSRTPSKKRRSSSRKRDEKDKKKSKREEKKKHKRDKERDRERDKDRKDRDKDRKDRDKDSEKERASKERKDNDLKHEDSKSDIDVKRSK